MSRQVHSPAIRAAYLRLVDQFHYTPTKQIPYFLYSSQREFQTTNIFQVGESVLGVTSPRDLKMSLPYFGDHEKFREVSTHEMVHQFTIQKMMNARMMKLISTVTKLPQANTLVAKSTSQGTRRAKTEDGVFSSSHAPTAPPAGWARRCCGG